VSVQTSIFGALASIFDGRVYPSTFPQPLESPQWPAARYTLVASTQFNDACGDDEPTDDSIVQLDVVALEYDEMVALKIEARAAMVAITDPPCSCEGWAETFDAETKTHRAILRFSFYPSTVAPY
jgi:hypothetical protein